jgi:hypothetical protein
VVALKGPRSARAALVALAASDDAAATRRVGLQIDEEHAVAAVVGAKAAAAARGR